MDGRRGALGGRKNHQVRLDTKLLAAEAGGAGNEEV